MVSVIPLYLCHAINKDRYLFERSAWTECRPLLQLAEVVAQKGLQVSQANGPDRGDTFADLTRLVSDVANTLGRVNMVLGNFGQSLQCFQEAIAARKSLGETDNELIYMKRNVASAYLCMGQMDEAVSVLHEASTLADDQFVTGRANMDVYRNNQANMLGLLSSAHLLSSQYDDAWEAAFKSTELCRSIPDSQGVLLAE